VKKALIVRVSINLIIIKIKNIDFKSSFDLIKRELLDVDMAYHD
jgi:hypothetical protein